jgi:hypothetical protein
LNFVVALLLLLFLFFLISILISHCGRRGYGTLRHCELHASQELQIKNEKTRIENLYVFLTVLDKLKAFFGGLKKLLKEYVQRIVFGGF